jgi:hypothetical protein
MRSRFRDQDAVLRLTDAATAFAMELAAPGLVGRDQFGMLDRSTALAELAALADHRPDRLWLTRRSLDAHCPPGVDELLETAALWAAFTGDD